MCHKKGHHNNGQELNIKLLYEIMISLKGIEECLEDIREHFEYWQEVCEEEEEEGEEYCDECGQEEEEDMSEESCRC